MPSRKTTVMDEDLIELLKEMAASAADGQIEISRHHRDRGLAGKHHRAGLLVDKGYAEWVSRSRVRITASGYAAIPEFESQDAADKEVEGTEAKADETVQQARLGQCPCSRRHGRTCGSRLLQARIRITRFSRATPSGFVPAPAPKLTT